jgi:integrase
MTILKVPRSDFWYAKFMVDGKNYQRSLKTTNKKLAEKLAQQYYDELIAETNNLLPKKLTISEAFKRYSKTVPGTANKPFEFYLKWLEDNKFVKPDDDISKITSEMLDDITTARRDEGKAEGTVFQTVGFIFRAIQWCKKNGYETSDVEKPRIKLKNSKLRWLTKIEEELLLEELDPNRRKFNDPDSKLKQQYQDYYDLTILLLDTGARLNEITSLKWKDVDLKKETISLFRHKTSNEAVLYMTKRVKEMLKRRVKTDGYIFEDTDGGPKRAVRGIKSAMIRADLKDCSIHTLRHTAASRMVQNGVRLEEVQHILGHSNVAMTQRYAHIAKSDVSKKARDALDNHADYTTKHIILDEKSLYKSTSSTTQKQSIYDDLLTSKSDLSTIQLS